eukprot:CAMPEP_0172898472 /NCGR_PEP_ID=MMETSP1075-20121228/159760_1 /TAXON_ID=2916 /ORGANISM="Ceratium fusus, Strain PA161109" /LENGTH=267 /DNA_ID=CAMNT_0013754257 /DNA_START=78 /DNA_END=883 /DNA_ORIENTATION=+
MTSTTSAATTAAAKESKLTASATSTISGAMQDNLATSLCKPGNCAICVSNKLSGYGFGLRLTCFCSPQSTHSAYMPPRRQPQHLRLGTHPFHACVMIHAEGCQDCRWCHPLHAAATFPGELAACSAVFRATQLPRGHGCCASPQRFLCHHCQLCLQRLRGHCRRQNEKDSALVPFMSTAFAKTFTCTATLATALARALVLAIPAALPKATLCERPDAWPDSPEVEGNVSKSQPSLLKHCTGAFARLWRQRATKAALAASMSSTSLAG